MRNTSYTQLAVVVVVVALGCYEIGKFAAPYLSDTAPVRFFVALVFFTQIIRVLFAWHRTVLEKSDAR